MKQINLFAQNFSPPSCVRGKTPELVEYVERQMEWDGATLFEDEFINSEIVDQVQSKYKLAWLHEPFCLHPSTYERAWEHSTKFDALLTYYQPFLERCDNAVFTPYAGVWVPREYWGIHQKTERVSMLIGAKRSTRGHQIRHEIAEALDQHRFFPKYYGVRGLSVNYSAYTKIAVNAPFMFTIVTETCREENEFTEWLLDCFAVGTVPIFWGCPNVGDFFDENGVLPFETVDDLLKLYPYLTADLYDSMLPSIQHNYNLVADYEITDDWIYRYIIEGNYE